VSTVYPIGGEIAPGDALTDTVHSPVLVNRTPAPGTYYAPVADGTTRINVALTVATGVQELQSVTVAGKPAKADGSEHIKTTVVLPLGTWPRNVSATHTSGDRTSWDRTYTVPSQMSSLAPLGALVPDGTNPVPLPTATIKPGGTVRLSLAVSSCGRPVSNRNAPACRRGSSRSREMTGPPAPTIAPGTYVMPALRDSGPQAASASGGHPLHHIYLSPAAAHENGPDSDFPAAWISFASSFFGALVVRIWIVWRDRRWMT